MNISGQIQALLPTRLARLSTLLAPVLSVGLYALPEPLRIWLQASPETQAELLRLLLAGMPILVGAVVVTASVLHHCYFRTVNMQQVIAEADARLRKSQKTSKP